MVKNNDKVKEYFVSAVATFDAGFTGTEQV
jgi:hypothetical protein